MIARSFPTALLELGACAAAILLAASSAISPSTALTATGADQQADSPRTPAGAVQPTAGKKLPAAVLAKLKSNGSATVIVRLRVKLLQHFMGDREASSENAARIADAGRVFAEAFTSTPVRTIENLAANGSVPFIIVELPRGAEAYLENSHLIEGVALTDPAPFSARSCTEQWPDDPAVAEHCETEQLVARERWNQAAPTSPTRFGRVLVPRHAPTFSTEEPSGAKYRWCQDAHRYGYGPDSIDFVAALDCYENNSNPFSLNGAGILVGPRTWDPRAMSAAQYARHRHEQDHRHRENQRAWRARAKSTEHPEIECVVGPVQRSETGEVLNETLRGEDCICVTPDQYAAHAITGHLHAAVQVEEISRARQDCYARSMEELGGSLEAVCDRERRPTRARVEAALAPIAGRCDPK